MQFKLSTEKLKITDWILRIGLAITFAWIGFMILQEPLAWGSYVQPWAEALLPMPLEQMMITTGYLDIGIGILFLIPPVAFVAGILGAFHIATVLITSGVNEGTVRDFAILGACIAVAFLYFPQKKTK